jgi:protoporphyrinogen oxidase
LYGLPQDLVIKVIADFVRAQQASMSKFENYEQWLRASFGNTFAETFPMKYTQKYHTTAASNLTTDWIGPRLYRASLEEILRGALAPDAPNVHYISNFRYPLNGGFFSYIQPFYQATTTRLNHRLIRLQPKTKTLHFANGVSDTYDYLISSIPLPELVPLIDGAPRDVRDAAILLACSELVVVSVGVDRPDPIDTHWSYFYDEDVFFTRLSTPHRQSGNNVPDGSACLMAECYYSEKYRPLDRHPGDCIDPVIKDLHRCGVLDEQDRIIFRHAMHLKYANVIFDHDRAAALRTIHGFLDDVGVHCCGRYGLWAYIWTDQAFLSGERAAEKALGGNRRLAHPSKRHLGAGAT